MERRFADLFSGRITRFWDDNDDSDIAEPALDLYEDGNGIVVKAELPGMTQDDIQISFADNVLTTRGEKRRTKKTGARITIEPSGYTARSCAAWFFQPRSIPTKP